MATYKSHFNRLSILSDRTVYPNTPHFILEFTTESKLPNLQKMSSVEPGNKLLPNYKYSSVNMHLFAWEKDLVFPLEEFNNLETVLRLQYGFQVRTTTIQKAFSTESVKEQLQRYEILREDSLLIVTYIGHGSLHDGLFQVSATPKFVTLKRVF